MYVESGKPRPLAYARDTPLKGDSMKRRTNAQAFRTDWDHNRERTTVYARDTAAAVVLLRGRVQSFNTIKHAEWYISEFGGRLAKPTRQP